MTFHRTLNTALGVAFIALALSTSHLLDGPTEHEAAMDSAAAIQALRTSDAGSARREAAAARLCNLERGPNSEARWTADGDLVCTTRRGVKAVQVAGGSL